ncbi:MAG: hypothetical protein O3C63_05645 [Cyanobacteria bacterium]|nr:hypothetical protein [Cyanobacteriota bacterium]MDA1020188.1 hypothetical protein [Cyanobacteriota bacterium]
MTLLQQQLIASFIFGGGLVALQAYAAEKVPKQISGIVLALPSTIVVNFYFLGIILEPSEFHKILPVVPAPLAFSLIFITAYIYIAKWIYLLAFSKPVSWWELLKQTFIKPKLSKVQKILLITISAILASSIWLLLSLPLAISEFSNLTLSLVIFVIVALINHILINRACKKYSTSKAIKYKPIQQIARACFAGLMVATTVYFGTTLGPFWAGVIAMFPAAFLASITIIHYYHDHEALFGFFKSTPLGISSLVIYAIVADYSFAAWGPALGTAIAILISFVYSLILSRFAKA